MKKNIVLVTDIFTPYTTRSSTQMLIFSAIYALKKSSNLFVVAIYDFRSDESKIRDFFEKEKIPYVLLYSKINSEQNSKVKNLFLNIYETSFPSFVFDKRISIPFQNIDKIVSFVPSIEASCLGYCLKRKYKNAAFINVWTDVIAYNCMDSAKEMTFKKRILIGIERKLIKRAEANYYLGEQQCLFQKNVFSKYSGSMDYYYPSYYPYKNVVDISKKESNHSDQRVVYFGDMHSRLRNVVPLCQSAKERPQYTFDVIGIGDTNIDFSSPNLNYCILKERISNIKESLSVEQKACVSVCFLNKKGFSLPGKIFYNTDLPNDILIIKDGAFSNEIEKELSAFNRFFFCENTVGSIVSTLDTIFLSKGKKQYNVDDLSPEARFDFIAK